MKPSDFNPYMQRKRKKVSAKQGLELLRGLASKDRVQELKVSTDG